MGDLFGYVTFYLHFVAVAVQFVLGWFVDIPNVRRKYGKVTDDERTPLFYDTRSYGTTESKSFEAAQYEPGTTDKVGHA